MALSGLGLVGASLSSIILMKVCRVVEPRQSHLITPRFVLLNLAPIGAAMSATLACGNAVYLYLPVGFIQMLKAFTPTVTLLMLCLLRVEMPSPLVSLTVIGMCAGTAAATLGAAELDVVGLLIMLASETAEALRLVLTQKLLQNNNFGVRKKGFAPAAKAVLLLPKSKLGAQKQTLCLKPRQGRSGWCSRRSSCRTTTLGCVGKGCCGVRTEAARMGTKPIAMETLFLLVAILRPLLHTPRTISTQQARRHPPPTRLPHAGGASLHHAVPSAHAIEDDATYTLRTPPPSLH
jgi:hypothetical protein